MRLTVFLIIAATLKVTAESYGQPVSASLKNAPLEEVFTTVKQQTGYLFFYDRDMLRAAKPVTINARNLPLPEFLARVFSNQPLGYTIKDKTIFLERKAPPAATQQQAPVIGIVRDTEGEALIGVSIKVKGTATGTVTDMNGRFSIQASPGQVLVVTYIGFEPREVTVSGSTLDIALKQAVSALDEAVIIGYGATVRRKNTGSIATVQSKDIGAQPVMDPLAALQGRVAGLMITSANGLPGAGFTVRLRGQNSIDGRNDPLYVVDGVPFVAEPLNQFNAANGAQSPLASINPSDIERIDVLKDADATAIYGSRGANGVVLITTKKGKAGKTQFNFNISSGASKVVNMVNMLGTGEYLKMRREGYANDGKTPDELTAPDLLLWDQQQSNNWQKMIIGNTATFTDAQASVSGGTEQTRFLLSGAYNHQTSVLPGRLPFKRGAAHLHLDHTGLDGKFNFTASVNYSAVRDRSTPSDLTAYYDLAPNYPLYNEDGSYYWFGTTIQNPIAMLHRTSDNRTSSLIANGTLRYTVLPGLQAKVNLGYSRMNMKQVQTYPFEGQNPLVSTGSYSFFGNGDMSSWIVEPQLEYTRDIAIGNLQVLAGATWQEELREGSSVQAENFPSDALLEDMRSAGKLTPWRPSTYRFYRYTSGFGRITYNIGNKYIFNASFRRDGSTRFGPDYRFGNFGAVGAAWVFSEEGFMPRSGALSFGKLRASWGITGNDRIDDYRFLASWQATSFPYDNSPGIVPARLPNNRYRWEENRKLEAALELGFLHDRILFNTSFYRNMSGNQLVRFPLSSQTGFEFYTANFPAKVLNTGWEFEITSSNIERKHFSWKTSFNFSTNKNELKEYPGIESSVYKDMYVVGKSLSIIKGYQFTGINPETGEAQFLDLDGKAGISQYSDYVILGKTMPDFFGGLQNTLRYKGFELDVHFQFVKQEGPLFNYGYQSYPYGIMSNKDESALRRWRQKGDVTSVPRATTFAGGVQYDIYRLSSAVWGDASYIRLKNVSLRYDLSQLLQRCKIQHVSIYASAQNLLTITGYDGFDPETQGLAMPPMRTITAGVRMTL